jgi:hypothetical protein
MTIELVIADTITTHTQYEQAELTTDHAASSYGVPVLVVDGVAYGSGDTLPTRFAGASKAAYAVQASVNFGRVASGDPMVNRFLDSCPADRDDSPALSPEEQAAWNKSIDDMFTS